MKKQIKSITYREVEDAIFLNKLPSITSNIYPYSYTFTIINDPLPTNIFEWIPFLTKAMCSTIPISIDKFLMSTTFGVFSILVEHYTTFYENWIKAVRQYTSEISDTNHSKFINNAINKVPMEKVIPLGDTLNFAQLYTHECKHQFPLS